MRGLLAHIKTYTFLHIELLKEFVCVRPNKSGIVMIGRHTRFGSQSSENLNRQGAHENFADPNGLGPAMHIHIFF